MKHRTVFLAHVLLAISFEILATSAFAGSQLQLGHYRAETVLRSTALITTVPDQSENEIPIASAVILDIETEPDSVFIVTNRHVLVNKKSIRVKLRVFSRQDTIATHHELTIDIRLANLQFFPSTPDSDFAAIKIPRSFEGNSIIGIRPDQSLSIDKIDFGDEVEFWGFPIYSALGLYRGYFDFPLVRRGIVAMLPSGELRDKSGKLRLGREEILIDGVSMGGNSGGPVFRLGRRVGASTKIEVFRTFIGIVRGHYSIPEYLSDTSVSVGAIESSQVVPDTSNSGFAIVVSSGVIFDYLKRRFREIAEAAKH